MKLHELVECEECAEVNLPTRFGSCQHCGSYAVAWVVNQRLWLQDLPQREPAEVRLCGIDREFLREIGIEA